jgi:EpsI family protein
LPQAFALKGESDAVATVTLPALQVTSPWRLAATDQDWRPGIAGADAEIIRTYVENGARVDLLIALFARQREGAEAVTTAHWPGILAGWREVSRVPVMATVEQVPMRFDAIVTDAHGRKRLVWVCYWVRGRFTASGLIAKFWQVQARLLGTTPAAAVIVASVPFVDDPASGGETFRRFLRHLEPLGPALSAAIPSSR